VGVLLRTADGGATWQRLAAPAGGPVEFVSPTTGWLTPDAQPDTTGAGTIYVTRDAGRTWHPRTVTRPAGYRRDQVTFTIPAFTRPAGVVLAAFDNGHRSAAGFYQAEDGGAAWRLTARVPARSPGFGDVTPAAAITGPGHWWAVPVDGAQIADVTRGGARKRPLGGSGAGVVPHDVTFRDRDGRLGAAPDGCERAGSMIVGSLGRSSSLRRGRSGPRLRVGRDRSPDGAVTRERGR